MARKKTLLAFNPDTMRVSDVKDAAKALRNLLRRMEQLRENFDKDKPEDYTRMAEDMYLQLVQLEMFWTTNEEEAR
jgi:hypothetical protein